MFAQILGLVAQMNAEIASRVTDDLIEKLRKWLDQLRRALAQLADVLSALSYTISVGAPSGVSVSLTFQP